MQQPSHANAQTLYQKVWAEHLVRRGEEGRPDLLYIDRHLIHEVTSPQAFQTLRERGLKVRRPDLTTGVIDHSTPTLPASRNGARAYVSAQAKTQVQTFFQNCSDFGVDYHGWDSPNRGIVHVAAPELGLSLPGTTIVCGDSHTSTHGAFGALAFGIGTTEVGHVLATQCLFQSPTKTCQIQFNGLLPKGVSAKDLALAMLATVGFDGGTGHTLEYTGAAVRGLSMEGRMTLCNMSIEAGARAGMIAPDETTFAWLQEKLAALTPSEWDTQIARWSLLNSDPGARYDKRFEIDASSITPMVTYGTRPSDAMPIDAIIGEPKNAEEANALAYLELRAGQPLLGEKVSTVFIGSCTNSRLSDLRDAARIMEGNHVAEHIRALVVPGSNQVKAAAEREGLDKVFLNAGAEWREPGCSMCIAMNGDVAGQEGLTMSTSNRNFVGRQGPGAKTILCSPMTAAVAAIRGEVTDPRRWEQAGL